MSALFSAAEPREEHKMIGAEIAQFLLKLGGHSYKNIQNIYRLFEGGNSHL